LNKKILILLAAVGVFGFGSATALMGFDTPTTVQLYKVSTSQLVTPPQFAELNCDAGDLVVSGYVIYPDGVDGHVNTVAINNGEGMIISQHSSEVTVVTYQIICAKEFSFPMMDMIGGVLLDIDSTSLLVASIGSNPVIAGMFAVTVAGVAGQAVWFVHRRKNFKNS